MCELRQRLGVSLYEVPRHQKTRRDGGKAPYIIELGSRKW